MFNTVMQDALDIRGQLVDHGEVAEDRSAVSYHDGPHRWRRYEVTPGD